MFELWLLFERDIFLLPRVFGRSLVRKIEHDASFSWVRTRKTAFQVIGIYFCHISLLDKIFEICDHYAPPNILVRFPLIAIILRETISDIERLKIGMGILLLAHKFSRNLLFTDNFYVLNTQKPSLVWSLNRLGLNFLAHQLA